MSVFEIGPGTGIATRELLRRGANPLTLLEPDRRLARYLTKSLGPLQGRVNLFVTPFESAILPSGTYDLGIAASSFHWTSENRALRKVARLLRPGGWWASWNTIHGDPYRSSLFNRAIQPIYNELAGGHSRAKFSRTSAAQHRKQGLAVLKHVGKFDRISREDIRWQVTLGTSQVTALWGTFSDLLVLPAMKRRWFLARLAEIVDEEFDGRVQIPMLTYIYTARRA
ncbi:MAG: class I SAM-dependent methyltransferase [Thermoplasmata archaeon]|nr:class I SAM-dependent methyltransferase [Thermoplasmata archaeon]